MSEDKTERVDWVVPVAKDADISKVPLSNLAKATERHGIQVDIKKKSGKLVADIYQDVVEGMPAPKPQDEEKK